MVEKHFFDKAKYEISGGYPWITIDTDLDYVEHYDGMGFVLAPFGYKIDVLCATNLTDGQLQNWCIEYWEKIYEKLIRDRESELSRLAENVGTAYSRAKYMEKTFTTLKYNYPIGASAYRKYIDIPASLDSLAKKVKNNPTFYDGVLKCISNLDKAIYKARTNVLLRLSGQTSIADYENELEMLETEQRLTSGKLCEKTDSIGGDTNDTISWIEAEGADNVIRELEEAIGIYKVSKNSQDFIKFLNKAKKLAVKEKIKELKEKEATEKKEQANADKVNAALSNASEKTKKRIASWIQAINDSPSPEDLQNKLVQFLGGKAEKWYKGSPIYLHFKNHDKIMNEKIKPVLSEIKPYYDMIMAIYNMDISLDTVVNVVKSLILLQFAPFIQKYNQYVHTVNEVALLTTEVNLLKSAVENKVAEFARYSGQEIPLALTMPDVPELPTIPELPISFGSEKPKD